MFSVVNNLLAAKLAIVRHTVVSRTRRWFLLCTVDIKRHLTYKVSLDFCFFKTAIFDVVIITNRDRFKRHHLFVNATRWQSRDVPLRLKFVLVCLSINIYLSACLSVYDKNAASHNLCLNIVHFFFFVEDFSFDLNSAAPWERDTSVTTATDPSKTTCTIEKNTLTVFSITEPRRLGSTTSEVRPACSWHLCSLTQVE